MFIVPSVYANDECVNWFKNSGALPSAANCELKCASTITDMATFHCPQSCEKYCKPKKSSNCKLKESLRKKIKKGSPQNWPHPEKESPFSNDDIALVEKALARLPDNFSFVGLKGIYKLERAKSLFSVGTPATYSDGQIVLYQKAFNNPKDIPRVVLHEIVHHLHESGWKTQFKNYKDATNWSAKSPRDGDFLSFDSKDSPEEDFATNVEYYLFEPEKLKNKVPHVFKWMNKNIKMQFQLKECR